VATGVIAVAVVAVLLLFLDGGERPTVVADQYDAPVVTVGSAGGRAWAGMTPVAGVQREGWPTPMVARDTEFCFGFGRVDFTPTRPGLARCVEARGIPDVPANGIVRVMMIRAGLDNWHVLITGSEAESFEVATASDGPLPQDRVHIDDDVVVLRLPSRLPVAEVSWVNGRSRYVCRSDLDAATSGRFCGSIDDPASDPAVDSS
jgi:hypothetical protein